MEERTRYGTAGLIQWGLKLGERESEVDGNSRNDWEEQGPH